MPPHLLSSMPSCFLIQSKGCQMGVVGVGKRAEGGGTAARWRHEAARSRHQQAPGCASISPPKTCSAPHLDHPHRRDAGGAAPQHHRLHRGGARRQPLRVQLQKRVSGRLEVSVEDAASGRLPMVHGVTPRPPSLQAVHCRAAAASRRAPRRQRRAAVGGGRLSTRGAGRRIAPRARTHRQARHFSCCGWVGVCLAAGAQTSRPAVSWRGWRGVGEPAMQPKRAQTPEGGSCCLLAATVSRDCMARIGASSDTPIASSTPCKAPMGLAEPGAR